MAINFSSAVAAYDKIARQDTIPNPGKSDTSGASGFADVLRDSVGDAIGALRAGETQTIKAAAGTADLNDVITAVGKAEMTLQTVVAVRDRVIQAYQEIIRMPV